MLNKVKISETKAVFLSFYLDFDFSKTLKKNVFHQDQSFSITTHFTATYIKKNKQLETNQTAATV